MYIYILYIILKYVHFPHVFVYPSKLEKGIGISGYSLT